MPPVPFDDPPEVQALKTRLYNVRQFLVRPLSAENFQQAVAEITAIWKAWDVVHDEQTPHDPGDCNGEDCQICRQFWKDDMADRTERNE